MDHGGESEWRDVALGRCPGSENRGLDSRSTNRLQTNEVPRTEDLCSPISDFQPVFG